MRHWRPDQVCETGAGGCTGCRIDALCPAAGLVRRHASPPRALADDVGAAGTAAVFGGLVANPICAWSCWTLYSTGAGLPPGPAGLLGAAEGVRCVTVCVGGAVRAVWPVSVALATEATACTSTPQPCMTSLTLLSYLVVLAIVGWSVATKLQTGSGLPAGPSGTGAVAALPTRVREQAFASSMCIAGLLGAVEGVSYVTLVAACAVAALKATGAA